MFSFLKKKGCPGCHDTYKTFGFEDYNQKYASSLVLIRKLKYGDIYKCKRCYLHWFLDEDSDRRSIHRIELNNLSFIERWGTQDLKPSPSILDTLVKIGASGEEAVKVPCKCKTKDNRNIDFCIVTFVKHPLEILKFKYKDVLLINEIAEISESSYALPHLVRYASFYARETRMLFAPIQAVSEGKYFIIGGYTNFFDLDGYKGSNINLPVMPKGEQEIGKYYYEQYEKNTYIIADWGSQEMSLIPTKPSNYRDLYKIPWFFFNRPLLNKLARNKIRDFTDLFIHKYIEFNDLYICVFDPLSSKYPNIAAFDKSGNFIWQMAHENKLGNSSGKGQKYKNIYIDNNNNVLCVDFTEKEYQINPKTGEILEHVYAK